MQRPTGIAALLLCALPVAALLARQQLPPVTKPARIESRMPPGFLAKADEILTSAYPMGGPGAAAIITKDGRPVYRRATGLADLEFSTMLEPDMVFRIGSVTKQFTAAGVLLLADRGALRLEDEITKYVPDFDTGTRHVTIEHLLTHTSGIKNYTDVAAWRPTWGQDLTPSQLVAFVKPDPFEFEPGSRWAYSNTGYILLGMVIEKASGTPYAEFMRKEVLLPLGLSRTMYDDPMKIVPRRARGYVRVNGELLNAPYLSMTHPFAAGALVSTVDDLARWDAALTAHRLLKPESLARMFVPYRLQSGESAGYAMGWVISSYEGHALAEHGGGIPGFTCQVVRFADDKVYVAVLSNDMSGAATRTAHLLAALAVGRPFVNPPEITLSPTTLDSFAGRYAKGKDVVTVSRSGNHLKAEFGESTIELAASAGTAFYEPGGPTRVTFSTEAANRAKEMIVSGWGDRSTYVRQ